MPVLAWLLLSSYHLIDFLLWFTPFYGVPIAFKDVALLIWTDIGWQVHWEFEPFDIEIISGLSVLGFLFVIYFYRKLVANEQGEIERERLSNVAELNITGVDLEAY